MFALVEDISYSASAGEDIGRRIWNKNKNNGRLALVVACISALPLTSFGQKINGAGLKVLGTAAPDTPSIPGQPLETRPAFGEGQRPAFPSQTRALAVITKTPLEERVAANNLDQPWGMAFLPGGKLLITEKPGAMRRFEWRDKPGWFALAADCLNVFGELRCTHEGERVGTVAVHTSAFPTFACLH